MNFTQMLKRMIKQSGLSLDRIRLQASKQSGVSIESSFLNRLISDDKPPKYAAKIDAIWQLLKSKQKPSMPSDFLGGESLFLEFVKIGLQIGSHKISIDPKDGSIFFNYQGEVNEAHFPEGYFGDVTLEDGTSIKHTVSKGDYNMVFADYEEMKIWFLSTKK